MPKLPKKLKTKPLKLNSKILIINLNLNFMSFREWAQNISAHREAAKQARADAKAEAERQKKGLEAGKHRAAMAEKAKADVAGAIMKESYNAQRIADAQARIAAAGEGERGFTEAEIDDALADFKPAEGPEAETGQALKKAFGEYEQKQAGGKN